MLLVEYKTGVYLVLSSMIAFSIGSIDVYRYGIFYFIAFLVGYLFFHRIAKQNIFWTKFPRVQTFFQKHIDDLILCIFFGVLVWWRLGHVIIYDFQYYWSHPGDILQIRRWWMSFIGGIFGVTIALVMLARKKRFTAKELLLLGDMIFAILPFGIMVGRIGNFLNQELYGIVVSDWLPRLWYPLFSILNDFNVFYVYTQVDNQLRVNTNLLASCLEWLVLLILTLSVVRKRVRTKSPQPGKIVAVFLIWYSFIRFVLEYLRADSQLEFHGWFTTSQRFFLWFFLLGVMTLIRQKRNLK